MIKNLVRLPHTFSQSLQKARFSSYIYNNLNWAQDYPAYVNSSKGDLSVQDLYAEVKDKKAKYLNEIPIPYNFKGTKPFKPLKRVLDQAVLNDKKVNLDKVGAKLQNYVSKYFKALSTGDPKDLPPCESNFLVSFLRSYHILQKSGFSLELRQSTHELKEKGLKERVDIFETMHIMGLNVERAKNMPIENYNLDRSAEGRGLLMYIPKENLEQIDSKNQEENLGVHPTLNGYRPIIPELQVILRIYAQVTTASKIIPLQGGSEALGLDDYTFRHVAVFENQLRLPPPGSLAYKSSEEMIELYRLQDWKLVDFDAVLQGNPLLVDKAAHSKLLYCVPE